MSTLSLQNKTQIARFEIESDFLALYLADEHRSVFVDRHTGDIAVDQAADPAWGYGAYRANEVESWVLDEESGMLRLCVSNSEESLEENLGIVAETHRLSARAWIQEARKLIPAARTPAAGIGGA